MTLQTSGQITLQDIAYEFDDAAPHQLSEFYGAATGIPTSGQIQISDFYGATASFYNGVIDGSARFEDGSSAYLSRTPSSAGNRKTYTHSFWLKRGNLGGQQTIVLAGGNGSETGIEIRDDKLNILYGGLRRRSSNARLRDCSSWYHIVCAFDTTQATGANRLKMYINGEQVTDWAESTSDPSQNAEGLMNDATAHHIGKRVAESFYFDGYLAEYNFIDGQALTPTSFGESKNGCWIPKAYSGSYGTNGFRLDFGTSLTADQSGNGNNFTANNMGSTDLMLDTPENNFCTMMPNAYSNHGGVEYLEGNLRMRGWGNGGPWCLASHGFNTGKWYFEFESQYNYVDGMNWNPGIIWTEANYAAKSANNDEVFHVYAYTGNKDNNSGWPGVSHYGSNFANGDIIQVAVDKDNGKIWFGKNGSWYNNGSVDSSANPATGTNPAFTSTDLADSSRTYIPFQGFYDAYSSTRTYTVANFGQDSSFAGTKTAQGNSDDNGYGDFYYSPPTGFSSLCTANLEIATGVDPFAGNSPQDYFNTVLWTGNSSYPRTITGVGFQPDLVWSKARSTGGDHLVYDVVRGTGTSKSLSTSQSYAEGYYSVYSNLTAFATDGFTVGTTSSGNAWNTSGTTYVAWNWKANGSGVSNTDGTITSTVSANTDAGFSIVGYTGNSTNGSTIGHGLTQTPDFIVVKCRSNSGPHWSVHHQANGYNKAFYLNLTNAASNNTAYFQNASSTTFTLGTQADVNYSGRTYIAYCFHSVEGFSKFGKYTGNGVANGPFIYTGFRPAFVIFKNVTTGANWWMFDNKRDPNNDNSNCYLAADTSNTEYTNHPYPLDFVSNGIKMKHESTALNANGHSYIYMAFAENPFKYANAR